MSLTQTTEPLATPAECPVDHRAYGSKKSVRPSALGAPRLQPDGRGGWQVGGFEEARAILRSSATRQAGFQAEMVNEHAGLSNPPILYQHGKVHQEQRAKTARFFAPKTVSANYRRMMETLADHLVARVRRERRADLSELSMALAVQVAGQVVGLTNSPLMGRVRRLEAFFDQAGQAERPTVRSRVMQLLNLGRMLAFYWRDVRPAIRARRRRPQEDVITHLLAQNYTDREILTECVTFAAAGMATTREFVVMAAWHLLEQPALRARYLIAGDAEREAILHEILRLEPVVGHLYRRATEPVTLTSDGQAVTIPSGALIDLNIEAVNLDERIVGADPQAVCPARPLSGDRVGAMLMSFGDGAHRCPGAYLAIQETDIFLQRLLALDGLRLAQPPVLTWHDITAGYELRRCIVTLDPA
jgi:cytochrome P450